MQSCQLHAEWHKSDAHPVTMLYYYDGIRCGQAVTLDEMLQAERSLRTKARYDICTVCALVEDAQGRTGRPAAVPERLALRQSVLGLQGLPDPLLLSRGLAE